MSEYEEAQKVHMITKLTIDQCKSKLQNKLKKYSLAEFTGKIEGNNFRITHFDSKNFGVRYSTPIFKGELLEAKNGTVINGEFDSKFVLNIFHKIAIAWASIIGGILFILAIIDLIFGTENIQDGNQIFVLIVIPIFILGIVGLIKFAENIRKEDRAAIINMLRDQLEAQDLEESY